MEKIVLEFIKRNNINMKKIKNFSEGIIYSIRDKNVIAAEYGIYEDYEYKYVSVGDMIGYDYYWNNNSNDLVDDMDNFFQNFGDSYHSRANGMLNYTSNNIIEKLNSSFTIEPMSLSEVDGNYFIDSNGLHRFHVMRLLYLNEIINVTDKDEINCIKNKYMVKVKTKKLDYIKTYCNYILSLIENDYWLSSEYNKTYNKTGRTKLELNGKEIFMTDEELINFTLKRLQESVDNNQYLDYLNYNLQVKCESIFSFDNFMKTYFNNFSRKKEI